MKLKVILLVLFVRLKSVQPATISSVTFGFEVFSPKSFIRFFEFSDVGWNISQECIRSLYTYLDGLQKDAKWAFKLLDASGNYAGGFYYGQNQRVSHPNQCYQLNDELDYLISQDINSSNLLNTSSVVPFFVQLVSTKYTTYVDSVKREIHQTACMPVSCSYDDLVQVMSFAPLIADNPLMKDTELVKIRVLYQKYKFYLDIKFTLIVAIASVMFVLNFAVSVYECYYRTKMKTMKSERFNRNISCHPEVYMKPKCVQSVKAAHEEAGSDIKHCKSKTANFKMNENEESLTISTKNCNHLNLVKLQKNKTDNTITLDIISTNCNLSQERRKRRADALEVASETRRNIFKFSFQNQLSTSTPSDTPHDHGNKAIDGIRVLSLFWIILLNTTTILSYASNNLKFVEAKETNWLIHLIFKNGSFSFDSYFFVNGLLLCQMFFTSSRELKINNASGIAKHFQHFFLILIFKVLRVLLPYLAVIHSLRIAMKHFHETSILNVPSNDHFTCDNIWKNLVFLENFSPYEERCTLWTWYLSVELQFFLISLLVLMLSNSSKKFAVIIFLGFFTSTFFTTTSMNIQSSKFTQITNLTEEEKLMHFNGIFGRPLVHLGPYIVGIFFGYFAIKTEKRIRIHPVMHAIGWLTSVVLFTLLMMSSFKLESVNPWVKHSFDTISHTFWSLVLMWICFASMSDHSGVVNRIFSSNFFQMTSKISNSILFIHPLILRVLILGSNNAVFISLQLIVIAFFGFAVISFACGLAFYVTFEGPAVTILNIIYEKLVEKTKYNDDY